MQAFSIFLFTIISVLLTINVETAFFVLQLKGKIMEKKFGKRAFTIHAVVTSILWTLSSLFIFLLYLEPQITFSDSIAVVIVGILILAVGMVIAICGFKALGLKRSLGVNFYQEEVGEIHASIYKYIKNPEDIGFWLLLIGFTMFTQSLYYLIIALEFIILMIPHEMVENLKLK
jgi:protein-S-isoprenylcysteine O-methyltransferase Ste14